MYSLLISINLKWSWSYLANRIGHCFSPCSVSILFNLHMVTYVKRNPLLHHWMMRGLLGYLSGLPSNCSRCGRRENKIVFVFIVITWTLVALAWVVGIHMRDTLVLEKLVTLKLMVKQLRNLSCSLTGFHWSFIWGL